MERLETILAAITLFDAPMRAFLMERASSMSPKALADFTASLSSYLEERQALQTEYQEGKKLLEDELLSEVSRYAEAGKNLQKNLTEFSQSLEIDPEELIAS